MLHDEVVPRGPISDSLVLIFSISHLLLISYFPGKSNPGTKPALWELVSQRRSGNAEKSCDGCEPVSTDQ